MLTRIKTYLQYIFFRRLYINCVDDYGLLCVTTRWARRRTGVYYRKYYSKEQIEKFKGNFY